MNAFSDMSTKSLLTNGTGATLPTNYNPSMYNNPASLYGMQSALQYATNARALKSSYNPSMYNNPAALYGMQSALHYANPYNQGLDYLSSYAYSHPYANQYYAAAGYTNPLGVSSTSSPYGIGQSSPCTTSADVSGQYSASTAKDGTGAASKPKKSKAKKKKAQDANQSPESDWERIFVWDLDGTLIMLDSLSEGQYAQKFGKNITACMSAGYRMRELVYAMGDRHFFLTELQDCDQVNIDDLATDDTGQDLSNYNFAGDGFMSPLGTGLVIPPAQSMRGGMDWMRKLAFRYRKIRDMYTLYRDAPQNLFHEHESFVQTRSEVEQLTDQWQHWAMKTLSLVASRPRYANVVVTTSPLTTTLVKLLVYGLAPFVPVENIYSCSKIGKDSCFDRVHQKFGKKSTYVVVGRSRDEEQAAKSHNFPFWRISSRQDLVALHHALDMGHL